MKIIVIPDSFKGTLTAIEVSKTLEKALDKHEVISVPACDGGEGTLEAFYHAKAGNSLSSFRLVNAPSMDALGREIQAPYLLSDRTAIIEMAKVAGFNCRSCYGGQHGLVMQTTTYGVGMLIKDALSHGVRKVIVGLGGSCTNDGGCGMAAALGTGFYGKGEGRFVPVGKDLSEIAHVDNTETTRLIAGDSSAFKSQIDIVGMCDVSNPLCGKKGAAYVFAPQKGASLEEVEILDKGLEHLISVIGDDAVIGTVTGRSLASVGGYSPGHGAVRKLADLPGSGAAGGMGFGIRAFLGGRLVSGIEMFLDTIDFDELLHDADYVITGEGSFDSQSLGGKAVSGITAKARAAGVPVILVAGTVDSDHGSAEAAADALKKLGIIKAFETGPLDFSRSEEEIKQAAIANLERTAGEVARYL